MENAVVQQIRKRITRSKFGEIFFVSSFPQYDVEYVTKLLAIFEKEGLLSKGWDIINRFSEDIDLALSRDYFLNVKQLSCASCTSNTQIHNLREKGQDYLFGEFKDELMKKITNLQEQFRALDVPKG